MNHILSVFFPYVKLLAASPPSMVSLTRCLANLGVLSSGRANLEVMSLKGGTKTLGGSVPFGGFLTWGYPQIIHFNGIFHSNHF